MKPNLTKCRHTTSEISVRGLFGFAASVTSIAQASSIYRVYIGHAPWTTEGIADFRLGGSPEVAIFVGGDGEYLHLITPVLPPGELLDIGIYYLEDPLQTAVLSSTTS